MRHDTMAQVGWPGGAAAVPCGVAVIDLGTDRGAPGDPGPRPPAARHRAGVTWALAFVLLTAAASGPPTAVRLRTAFRIAATIADTFALSGDALLLARRPAAGGGLWAYDLEAGRLRWRSAVAPPTSYGVRRHGGMIVVGERTGEIGRRMSVAVAADSGGVRWRHAGRLVPVDGSDVILAVSDVVSYFGVGRRIQGQVVGLDARTGATRWAVPVPSTAVLQPVPGTPARILLVHATGWAELRHVADGRPIAAAQLPAADYAPDNPTVGAGTVLLRHPAGVGTAVTAYATGSLQRRWTRAESAPVDGLRGCPPLNCLSGVAGVRGVESGDGAARWYRPDWRVVEQRGVYLLTFGARRGIVELLALADPTTGGVLVDLRGWRALPAAADGDILLARADRASGHTIIGVPVPASGIPRVLGVLPPGTGDCRAGPGLLVCRTRDGTIVGWRYRLPDR